MILRSSSASDAGWDVLVHNPLDRAVTITVAGAPGGPVAGLRKRLTLTAGEEMRWTIK